MAGVFELFKWILEVFMQDLPTIGFDAIPGRPELGLHLLSFWR